MAHHNIDVKSSHTPEVWKKLWWRRVVELTSENKSAYSDKTCYFGTIKGDELMVYFHRDSEGGHMTTRFLGKIEKDGAGSRITGRIGKQDSAIFFLIFGMIVFILGGIFSLVQGLPQQGLLLLAIGLVCVLLFLITPKKSAERLERLINQISVDPYDFLEKDHQTDSGKNA